MWNGLNGCDNLYFMMVGPFLRPGVVILSIHLYL